MPSWNQVVGFLTDWEGLRPRYEYENLAFGPFADGLLQSGRTAPHMSGLALLEAIPEGVLQEWADPNDADGDGISGRANSVWDATAGGMRTGRFGWKAEQPGVRHQVAAALNGDMGSRRRSLAIKIVRLRKLTASQRRTGGSPRSRSRISTSWSSTARLSSSSLIGLGVSLGKPRSRSSLLLERLHSVRYRRSASPSSPHTSLFMARDAHGRDRSGGFPGCR